MSTNEQTDLFGDQITASHQQMMQNMDGIDVTEVIDGWPTTLTELYEVLAYNLKQSQVANHKAEAGKLVLIIATHFGGRNFYLPKNDALKRTIRDIKIYNDFDGVNQKDLAKKYNLSIVEIYKILKRQTQIRFRQKQPSLDLS